MTPLINRDLLTGEYGDVLISTSLLPTVDLTSESVDNNYSRLLEIPVAKQALLHQDDLYLVNFRGHLYQINKDHTKELKTNGAPIKSIFFHQGHLQILDVRGDLSSLDLDTPEIENIKSLNYDLQHGYLMLTDNNRLIYHDMNDSDEVELTGKGEVVGLKDQALIYKTGHIQAVIIGHRLQIVPIIRLKNRIRDLLLNVEWLSLFTLHRGIITHYQLNFDYSVRRQVNLSTDFKPRRFLQISNLLAPVWSLRERVTAPAVEDEGGNIYLLPDLKRLELPVKLFNSANLKIGRMTKPANK